MITAALLFLNVAGTTISYDQLPEAPAIENPLRREWVRYKLYALLDQSWREINAGTPGGALPYLDEAVKQAPDFARARYTRWVALTKLKDARAETDAAWLRTHVPGLVPEAPKPVPAPAMQVAKAETPTPAPVKAETPKPAPKPKVAVAKPAAPKPTPRPTPETRVAATATTPGFRVPAPTPAPAPEPAPEPAPAPVQVADAQPKAPPPPPQPSAGDRGFIALKSGDLDSARRLFNETLAADPDNLVVTKQLAYLEKEDGYPDRAVALFKHAQDLAPNDPGRPALKREVAGMDRRLGGQAWLTVREGHFDPSGLPFARELGHSSAGAELDYRLPVRTFDTQEGLKLFARSYTGFEGNSLNPDGSSVQGGVGLALKPLKAINLTFAAERMIRIGDNARSDWMLRAAWGVGEGFTPPEGAARFPFWNVYTEGAMIHPSHPDLLGTVDARAGMGFALTDRIAVVPHGIFAVTAQRASGDKTTLAEAGVGLSVKYRFDGDAYADYRSMVEFRLEARMKAFGNGHEPAPILFTTALIF